MRNLLAAAATLALAVPALAEVPGYYPSAADTTITVSASATPAQVASWLGAPNDVYTGIGREWVQFDLGEYLVIDGTGPDFNVYEFNSGGAEWSIVDILVSANGTNFFNVEGSFAAAVDLIGDDAHGNANFRRSFDLGGAVASLGTSEFRFIRIDGTTTSALGGSNGFDLDAIGLVNWKKAAIVTPPNGGGGGGVGVIPEPATWAMMIAGFGLVGAAARRRREGRAVSA